MYLFHTHIQLHGLQGGGSGNNGLQGRGGGPGHALLRLRAADQVLIERYFKAITIVFLIRLVAASLLWQRTHHSSGL